MAENENDFTAEGAGTDFRESVCIDALRVYDSCSDKDCVEDTRVYFSSADQALADSASNVRIKNAGVLSVYLDLQPVPFHRGYYSVDMTFYIDVGVEFFLAPAAAPVSASGVCVFNKKVILYGSEGSVKVFTTDDEGDENDYQGSRSVPKAVVQVAEPIALGAKLCDCCSQSCCEPCCVIPEPIRRRYGDSIQMAPGKNAVYATVGLFMIVQIVRNTQMLIPAYDFCVPEKECVTGSDNPCELFRRIEFPVNEFFPPKEPRGLADDDFCEG